MIFSKKYQKILFYSFIVFLLFFASNLVGANSKDTNKENSSSNNSGYTNFVTIRPGINYGTRTVIIFVPDIVNPESTCRIDSLNYEVIRNRISQMTVNILELMELFGIGESFNGTLLIAGTTSIDLHKNEGQKKASSRNKNRIIIKETIKENPGINLREIQRTTDLAMGVIQYHIRNLESGEIESHNLGRSKHFFISSNSFSAKEKLLFSVNRNLNIKILLNLLEQKEYTQKELTFLTGNSKSLVSYYVKYLRNSGLIEHEKTYLRISTDFSEIIRKNSL
ncbi:MAG: ArsR family transcriptional regulator [Candidatus Hodarchaeales archaeon]